VPDKSVYSWSNIGIAVAGGLAAAAVFAVLTKGTLPGLLLAHLAPLPLLIVGLGFGLGHGATAALIAAAALTLWPNYMFGIIYSVSVALPAFLASYAISGAPWGRRDLLTRHRPAWACVGVGAVILIGALGLLGVATVTQGGVEEALNPIRARAYMILDEALRTQELPDTLNAKEMSGVLAHTTPAILAAYLLLVHMLNLWGAARLARVSSPIQMVWPDTVEEFVLPRPVAALFAVGVATATLGAGFVGVAGLIVSTVSGLALAFQGLAVTHGLLRGSKSSVLTLSILYFVLGVLGWPIVLLAALGVVDSIFDFRGRKAARLAQSGGAETTKAPN
jgi:hypothetical protein